MPIKEDQNFEEYLQRMRSRLISQEESDEFSQAQMYALLDKIGTENALRRFHEDYSLDTLTIAKKAGSGRQGYLVPQEEPYLVEDEVEKNRRITYADYSMRPTVTDKSGQLMKASMWARAIVESADHYSPNSRRGVWLVHSIGSNPMEQNNSMTPIHLYTGDAFGVFYRKIRSKFNKELKDFARENHLVKTPSARRRELRNKIGTGIAVATTVATVGALVEYGQQILQHFITSPPQLPFLP